MVQCYHDGATTFELAEQFGMHRQTVSRHLARMGIPIRSRAKLTPALVAELVRLYEEGQSTVQLGRAYSLAASSVGRALQKSGVTLRSPKYNRWHRSGQ
ncbi:hypothetical protein BXO91_23990 [Rhodococcus qingshengii]|nr:hypothetical protein BXO91_23990 [Rhodococcus qingshengii]